jgi:hypothetical protein
LMSPSVQGTWTDYTAPGGSIGLQYNDVVRSAILGLALQAPSRVSATGRFDARLPRSGFFYRTLIHAPRSNSRRGRASAGAAAAPIRISQARCW